MNELSRTKCRELAISDPWLLLKHIFNNDHTAGMRVHAVEAFTEIVKDEKLVISYFLNILEATDLPPLLKESTVVGLEKYLDNEQVYLAIKKIADNKDTSPGLQLAAKEILEEHKNNFLSDLINSR